MDSDAASLRMLAALNAESYEAKAARRPAPPPRTGTAPHADGIEENLVSSGAWKKALASC